MNGPCSWSLQLYVLLKVKDLNLFLISLLWQESQAVPLSNINSVMSEVNSGKMARRHHFQDEFPPVTNETTSEPGITILHMHTFKIKLLIFPVWPVTRTIFILKDSVKDSPLNSSRRSRSVSAPTDCGGGSLYYFFLSFTFFLREIMIVKFLLWYAAQQEMTLTWLVNELVSQ